MARAESSSPPRRSRTNLPHTLYRMYDRAGRLLWVGMTCNFAARMYEHRIGQPWFSMVDHTEREEHPNEASAQAAERAALLNESPIFNVMHTARGMRRNTSLRSVAVPDDPWVLALLVAHDRHEDIEDVVTRLLAGYVAGNRALIEE